MEPMKIERRRATMLPAFRPKRRTLDREQLLTGEHPKVCVNLLCGVE